MRRPQIGLVRSENLVPIEAALYEINSSRKSEKAKHTRLWLTESGEYFI